MSTPLPDPKDEVFRQTFIEAPPRVVFEYLTVPEKMNLWWGSESEADARPGGTYRAKFMGGKYTVRGKFVEVIPYERIVHTWGWEGELFDLGPGASTVEITLTPQSNGTLVQIRHYGLAGSSEFHGFGWDHYIPRLAIAAAGRDPGKDDGPEQIRQRLTEAGIISESAEPAP